MPKRVSDSARILNFFTEADLGKTEMMYEFVKDVMGKRLAPQKAAQKAKRAAKKKTQPAPEAKGPAAVA